MLEDMNEEDRIEGKVKLQGSLKKDMNETVANKNKTNNVEEVI